MIGRWVTRLIDWQEIWAVPLGGFVQRILQAIFRPMPFVKSFLNGTWLGHPLHAALTDGPIGILSIAVLFDILGLGTAAAWSVGIAVLLLLAAAATGLADYSDTDGLARHRATVHATIMTVAIVLAIASLALRWGDPAVVSLGPAALSAIAAGLLIAGAFIGGDVVYVLGNMVDRHAFRSRGGQWSKLDVEDVPEGKPTKAKAGAQAVVLVRQGERVFAMHDSCAHAACSLSDGSVVNGQIECPCHGSRYRLADGHVTRGPSVYDQPAFEVRKGDEGWEARLVRSGSR